MALNVHLEEPSLRDIYRLRQLPHTFQYINTVRAEIKLGCHWSMADRAHLCPILLG